MSSAIGLPGCKNIALSINTDGDLLVVIDLKKEYGPSASGKTTIVASTAGSKDLGTSNVKLGINAYCKDLTLRNFSNLQKYSTFNEFGFGIQWRVTSDSQAEFRFNFSGSKPSSTGSTMIIATSGGNKQLGETGIFVGINCFITKERSFNKFGLNDAIAFSGVENGQTKDINDAFAIRFDDSSDGRMLTIIAKGSFAEANQPQRLTNFVVEGISISCSLRYRESCSSSEFVELEGGQNVWWCQKGDELYLRAKLNAQGRLSSSRKSLVVASTFGKKIVGGFELLSLNIFRPAEKVDDSTLIDTVEGFLKSLPESSLLTTTIGSVYAAMQESLGCRDFEKSQRQLLKEHVSQWMQSRGMKRSRDDGEMN
jgi:hypothetical protein